MLKAGTETGSMMNHLMSRDATAPAVGMGATMLGWTDRRAGTIIKMTPTQIHVQRDKVTRTDKNGLSESQIYDYATDPDGAVTIFRKTNRGYRATNGNGLLIGQRAEYFDFSF